MQEIDFLLINDTMVHCPLCGMESFKDDELQICDHLIFVTTSESSEPEYDKESIFSKMNEDISHLEYLKNNLSNDYLCFSVNTLGPSFFESYHVYKLKD